MILDTDDIARLRELHTKLSPYFPEIAEHFHEGIRADLIDWMSTGLLGPSEPAFGRRHVETRLAQHLMFTAMSAVRLAYQDHIATLYPPAEALLVVRSVDKLFDIELALTLQAHRFTTLQTLCAGLAHEVRNPLNAATLQLDVLERRLRRAIDDTKLMEPVERVRQELARLTELLDDLLAYARPTLLHVTEVDVVALARQVIELERPAADHLGASLELERCNPVTARLDPAKIHQVLESLVRNAIEAAGAGGRTTIEVAFDGRSVHLRVRDTGSGIPDEIRTRIYEPFFSTKETGTGMGMSIAQNFVTMHGGTIDITTGSGGTTIDVQLPQRGPAI